MFLHYQQNMLYYQHFTSACGLPEEKLQPTA
jgi:hypothetical protein